LARGLPSVLAAQPVAWARRVALVCASFSRVAAYIDEDPADRRFHSHPDLRLVVRARHGTPRPLPSLACPEPRQVKAPGKDVIPAAIAARDGRVRSLRLWPFRPAT